MTNVFSNCQTTNAAKQIFTRTTRLSGVFDLIATFVAANVKENGEAGSSALYNSMQLVKSPTNEDCSIWALAVGTTMSLALNFEAPAEVYYEYLSEDLGGEE